MTTVQPTTDEGARRGLTLAFAVVLVIGVLAIYSNVGRAEFVNYDDDRYVTANAAVRDGLSVESMRWAFTSTTHASNWHPVTWLSHMLDVELHGLDPAGHHWTSVGVHAAAAVLLLFALALLTRRPWESFFAAALFAWHPLRVESVAWVAERKDVLSGLFAFLTILLYAGYARRGGALRYIGVVFAFALGLMSKSMLVTLPCVLLLVDRWPLRREASFAKLFVEKLPLFALSGVASWLALMTQSASGATGLLSELPLGMRALNAFAAVATYAGQLVWPTGLACLYPHASTFAGEPASELLLPAAIGLLLVGGGCALGWRVRRTHGYVLAGWLWTLGMLVPVIGIVQVGYQAHADRYTYLPLVGIGVALVFGAADAWRTRRRLLATCASVALLALAFSAHRQVNVWRDSLGLWQRCILVTDENFVAENNIGNLLARAGDFESALPHFEDSVRIYPGTPPDSASATRYSNLAGAYDALDRPNDALRALDTAIALDENNATLRTLFGRALADVGRDTAATVHLRRALELNERDTRAGELLAEILATSRKAQARDGAEALTLARALCNATKFEEVSLLALLAAAYAESGDFAQAIEWQERVIIEVEAFLRPEMRRRLNGYRRDDAWRKTP